jgi:hypothetical protein
MYILKSLSKPFVLLLLVFSLIFNCTYSAKASTNSNLNRLEDESYLKNVSDEELIAELSKLSNEELNCYIDDMIAKSNNISYPSYSANVITPVTPNLKAEWLAASFILKCSGYPLSGTLIAYSVCGNNYVETNGAFSEAIKGTSKFNKIRNSGHGSVSFERSDNTDLYLSLHSVSYNSRSSSRGKRIYIHDIYDFAPMKYDNAFVAIVNNWAYLCQHMDVLMPISVEIQIDA